MRAKKVAKAKEDRDHDDAWWCWTLFALVRDDVGVLGRFRRVSRMWHTFVDARVRARWLHDFAMPSLISHDASWRAYWGEPLPVPSLSHTTVAGLRLRGRMMSFVSHERARAEGGAPSHTLTVPSVRLAAHLAAGRCVFCDQQRHVAGSPVEFFHGFVAHYSCWASESISATRLDARSRLPTTANVTDSDPARVDTIVAYAQCSAYADPPRGETARAAIAHLARLRAWGLAHNARVPMRTHWALDVTRSLAHAAHGLDDCGALELKQLVAHASYAYTRQRECAIDGSRVFDQLHAHDVRARAWERTRAARVREARAPRWIAWAMHRAGCASIDEATRKRACEITRGVDGTRNAVLKLLRESMDDTV